MAQRANGGTLSATGGLFINGIRARWSLRVAVGGDADSSLEGQTPIACFGVFSALFVFLTEKSKYEFCCFVISDEKCLR